MIIHHEARLPLLLRRGRLPLLLGNALLERLVVTLRLQLNDEAQPLLPQSSDATVSCVRAASDHDFSASAARPLVRVQRGAAAPPSDGPRRDAAVIGVQARGLGAWLCCCCRTGEAVIKLAFDDQRLCRLWLPLVRLFAILCCCLRPVRNLLLLALPLFCETSCCCCSAACARIGRRFCHPRRRTSSCKRRSFGEMEELPSVELLPA